MSTMHSAGQLARQASIRHQGRGFTYAAPEGPPPVAGSIAVTDLIILALSGVLALLRSLPLAELFDFVVAAAIHASTAVARTVWFHLSSQPVSRDSPPPHHRSPSLSSSQAKAGSSHNTPRRRRRRAARSSEPAGVLAPSIRAPSPNPSSKPTSSSSGNHPIWRGCSSPPISSGSLLGPSEGPSPGPGLDRDLASGTPSSPVKEQPDTSETSILTAAGDARLTLFHHVVLVLARFACENFPFLVPRILLAEETVAPFVRWRTGGGAGALIREYGPDGSTDCGSPSESGASKPFCAYWIGGDSHLSPLMRRSDPSGRHATTILWIHGGGFIIGSVAFYAESLLRILAKVCAIEHDAAVGSGAHPPSPEARCIAVEYSLGPSARFPDALLECLRTYAHLIEVEQIDPEAIVLAGDSAGGNLALSMLLALNGQGHSAAVWSERDWSLLPLPGKAVLVSPWVDLRPKQALAFQSLRPTQPPASPILSPSLSSQSELSSDEPESEPSDGTSASTATVKSEDTGADYLVPEGLLHYAQVYSGVLDMPRRVSGPAGWISGLLRTLDTTPTVSALAAIPPDTGRGVTAFGRTLSSAVLSILDAPLFERSVHPEVQMGTAVVGPTGSATIVPTDAHFGMTPLFGPSERMSKPVANANLLYDADMAFGAQEKGDGTAETNARVRAAEMQADEPLMSPASGDWSQINLTRGMVAVYGSHELLGADIQRWCDTAGAESVVQHGPTGVHAWPLVNMYIAGTPAERERGLDMLACAMAHPLTFVHATDPRVLTQARPSSNVSSSPGSMPSDAWGIGSPETVHAIPDPSCVVYPADYPFPLFGDTPSEPTPSDSPTASNSDGEEDGSKLSGTPLHTYPPPRSSGSLRRSPSPVIPSAWWASVAASPSNSHSPLDSISERDTVAPPPPVMDPLMGTRMDGLSDITEETEIGSANSPSERVARGIGIVPSAATTVTATAGTAMAQPSGGTAPQVQGLGTAGDMLRAYLEIGPTPHASTPSVTPTRRPRAGGDVWW